MTYTVLSISERGGGTKLVTQHGLFICHMRAGATAHDAICAAARILATRGAALDASIILADERGHVRAQGTVESLAGGLAA